MKYFVLILTLVSCLFGSSTKAAQSLSIDEQLNLADELRTSDKDKFSTILGELKPEFDSFTINQKYFYIFLTGYEQAFKGDFEKAVSAYAHVFDSSQNLTMRYRASMALVNIYALNRNWNDGFKYLDFISQVYEQIPDSGIRHRALIYSSIFYNELEQYDLTLDIARRLLLEDVNGRDLCGISALNLKALMFTKNEQLSQDKYNQVIDNCEAAGESLLANVARSYMASYYFKNGQYDKSIDLLLPRLNDIQKTGYELLIAETNGQLAIAYRGLKRNVEAEKHAKKIVELRRAPSYIKPILLAHEVLYEIESDRGNYSESLKYLKEYLEVLKIEYEDTKAKQLAVELAKYQASEKDSQIELLNKQNTILRLEREISAESALYNRWLIGLLFVTLSILVMWVIYVKRSQKQLKYLAEYDSLTGICNRAYFNQSAETVLNYYSKTERAASMVLFDLDYFKRINDSFGHPMGDKVLKLAAEACKTCVRKVDIFGRVGGEEFAILLPGCEQEQAVNIAEECRKKISEIDVVALGIDSPITASFGIAESGTSGYLLKDMVAHSDEAMYVAKHRGRNQVVCHSKS